jgi:hypothetical protein
VLDGQTPLRRSEARNFGFRHRFGTLFKVMVGQMLVSVVADIPSLTTTTAGVILHALSSDPGCCCRNVGIETTVPRLRWRCPSNPPLDPTLL